MIQYLVEQIEARLGWGSGQDWSNKDFEELSERILTDTKKQLSVTTLKRIWGRAERIANPSSATLDILSQFVGYENWRDFVNTEKPTKVPKSIVREPKKISVPIAIGCLVVLLGILAFYWPSEKKQEKQEQLNTEDFAFKSKILSHDLPNSVVFNYDASSARPDAKIEIQQDWDTKKRTTVNRKDSVATSIYYHPGFFKSKLVVGGTIVKEEDVFIKTADWLGILERDTIPIYLDAKDINANGRLAITEEIIASYNLDPRTSEVEGSLYLAQDFGELYTDDFQLSLQVRNTFENGQTGCQWVKLFVLYDGGAIGIPLAKKGCAANMDLMAFGSYISGKNTDLSGLGVNFENFVSLKCNSENGNFTILVNDEVAYTMPVSEEAKRIIGLSIHFEGAGEVKQVGLSDRTGIVYSH